MIGVLSIFIDLIFSKINDKNIVLNQETYALLVVCSVVLLVYFGLFVLRAIATCVMAKKRKIKWWWGGMIPYANYIVLGKLSGPIRIFSFDIKNMGIIVCISAFLFDFVNLAYYVLPYFGQLNLILYNLLAIFSYILDLVFIFSYIALAFALFGKYAPQKRLLYVLLSLIQPLFGVLLMTIMNNKCYSSVDEFYREKMAKRYGQTYNPYQNPYQTNENPFDEQPQQKNENPFDEY